MLKKLFAIAVLVAVVSSSAFAQGNDCCDESTTATIEGKARVIVPLVTNWYNNMCVLNFGCMNRGDRVDIWAAGTASSPNNIAPAIFVISGQSSDDISINIGQYLRLKHTSMYSAADPDTYMDADLKTGGTTWKLRVDDNPTGFPNSNPGNLFAPGDCLTLSSDDGGNGVDNDGLGQLYVSVGAIAEAGATQQRGAYEGTITATIDYCNF